MTFTAVVLRTFTRSCEVYVVASAESHDHAGGNRRFTNDALFTLALAAPPDENAGGEIEGALRRIVIPEESPLETYAGAAERRKGRRLQLREMVSLAAGLMRNEPTLTRQVHPPHQLMRIYGPSEEQ